MGLPTAYGKMGEKRGELKEGSFNKRNQNLKLENSQPIHIANK